MRALKKYFAKEFRKEMFCLDHDTVSDFYLCSFKRNRSAVPLLCVRALLLLGCIGIIITSYIMTAMYVSGGYWFIYLTHWGLVLVTVACAFAYAVSLRAYVKGPIDGTFGLPWYVKTYWVTYNIAITIAIFISLFYWTLLAGADIESEYAVNQVLDIFIHGVNSILMFVLLVTARHPVNILHFYFSILLGIAYAIFTVIYYYAGGTDMFGNNWIYPMVDWSNPGPSAIMVVITAIAIIVVHLIVVGITAVRDALSRLYRQDTQTFALS